MTNRLGQLLSELTPGELNTFFFTLGGAEANENALRLARLYTGRQKVIARHRAGLQACWQSQALSPKTAIYPTREPPRAHPADRLVPG